MAVDLCHGLFWPEKQKKIKETIDATVESSGDKVRRRLTVY